MAMRRIIFVLTVALIMAAMLAWAAPAFAELGGSGKGSGPGLSDGSGPGTGKSGLGPGPSDGSGRHKPTQIDSFIGRGVKASASFVTLQAS